MDSSIVSQMVATQFPQWAGLPIEPVRPGGWDNQTFRLGTELSVRLPSAARYAPQVQKEQEWLPKLAPHLPLAIPEPVAMGMPTEEYPWQWSIYRWLDGQPATVARIDDLPRFATSLADFLTALHRIDPARGPRPGTHNFFRGGSLSTYDGETRQTVSSLSSVVDEQIVLDVWETGLDTAWQRPPLWIHGDVSAGNLLVKNGRLSTVIDFGCLGVGDPACDLTIAWTLFSDEARTVFREALRLDEATWARARCWALWKGLITLAEHIDSDAYKAGEAQRVIDEVLSDVSRRPAASPI